MCECALVGVIAQVIGTLLLQLLLLFDTHTVIATVIAVASSNSTAASQDPACTRDPRHTHAAHGRGARRGNGPTVGGGRSRAATVRATGVQRNEPTRRRGMQGAGQRRLLRARGKARPPPRPARTQMRARQAPPVCRHTRGGRPKRCRPRRTGRPRGGRGHETTKAVT